MNVKKLNEQGNDKCNTPNHDNEVSGTWGVMVVLLQDVAYLQQIHVNKKNKLVISWFSWQKKQGFEY